MLVLYFTNQALNLKAESCMQNQYNLAQHSVPTFIQEANPEIHMQSFGGK